MIQEFLNAYQTTQPATIPAAMLRKDIVPDENLVIYEISVANPTAQRLAAIAKLFLQDYTSNEFDLIVSISGITVIYSIYLRVDGFTFAPAIKSNDAFFKVRQVLADGAYHLVASSPPRALSTDWVSEHPYAYFVLGVPVPTENDMITGAGGAFTIPIPETVLRAICVRDRIDVATVQRVKVLNGASLFKTPLPGNHSRLFIVATDDTVPLEELLAQDIVTFEKDTVQFTERNVQVRIDGTFITIADNTPAEMEGVVRRVFYDN